MPGLTPAVDALEEMGLANIDSVEERLHDMDSTAVRRAADTIYDAISRGAKSLEVDPAALSFKFLASTSVRGDSGCRECAWKKLDSLARYAALYADSLILPVPIHLGCTKNDPNHLRHTLATQIKRIGLLRPLLDARLVALVPDHSCPDHNPSEERAKSSVQELATSLLRQNCRKFRLFIRPSKCRHIRLELQGPLEFLEHGDICQLLEDAPDWLPQQSPDSDFELTHEILHKSRMLDQLFFQIARDVVAHRDYGQKFGASYLTDLEGEAQVLQGTPAKNHATEREAAAKRLMHEVPLFRDLPISTLVRLRREEPAAFQTYRDSLNSAIKNGVAKGELQEQRAASSWFMDTIQPRLDALNQLAENSRKASLKSAVQNAATSAAIAIGLASVGQPLLAATAAMGHAARSLGDVADAISTPKEVRNSDLYYLLRLQRESRN